MQGSRQGAYMMTARDDCYDTYAEARRQCTRPSTSCRNSSYPHRLLAPIQNSHTHRSRRERLRRSFEIFAGTFEACPEAFRTPVERQKQGGQKLLSVGIESCKHKPPVSHLCRRPLFRPRDSVTSLRLPSHAGYPPCFHLLEC